MCWPVAGSEFAWRVAPRRARHADLLSKWRVAPRRARHADLLSKWRVTPRRDEKGKAIPPTHLVALPSRPPIWLHCPPAHPLVFKVPATMLHSPPARTSGCTAFPPTHWFSKCRQPCCTALPSAHLVALPSRPPICFQCVVSCACCLLTCFRYLLCIRLIRKKKHTHTHCTRYAHAHAMLTDHVQPCMM